LDRDGIPDESDNCPTVSNRDQADDDGDQLGNVCDNCPTVFNPYQTDTDQNGIGDLCDTGFVPRTTLTLQHVCMLAHQRRASSVARIHGSFDVSNLPSDLATILVHEGGKVAIDGAGLTAPEVMVFAVPRCLNVSASMIKCVGQRGETATFRKVKRSTSLYTFAITAGKRLFAPPLTTAPVSIVLSLGGEDLRSHMGLCQLQAARTLTCRTGKRAPAWNAEGSDQQAADRSRFRLGRCG
jgi:hypothetical protein